MKHQPLRRGVWTIIAIVAWIGVLGQLYVSATRVDAPRTFGGVFVEVFSFIDVNALGLPQVLINSAALAAIFLVAGGVALIAVDRALGRSRSPALA